MYQFSYLYGSLAVGTVWLIFFLLRPDLRRPMIEMSLLFGLGGVAAQIVYANDWWNPDNLTHTIIGIEDYLFGFFFGGTAGFAYEVLFSRKLSERDQPKPVFSFRYLGSLFCLLFFGIYYATDLHSFVPTILAFGIPTLILLWLRPDLIPNSIFVAGFSISLAYCFIGVPELLTPGWVDATWQFDYLSGIRIWIVPLEDFIWFIVGGAFMGPLYKYWKNKNLTR